MQKLMIFNKETNQWEICIPDIKCPSCGFPWKEGCTYGHNICCGCEVCGHSNFLFDIINSNEAKELTKIRGVITWEDQ